MKTAKTRRESPELDPGVPHVPAVAEELREAAAEAVVRTIWLENMSSGDVTRRLSSIRSCELAQLKAGDTKSFGLNRIINLATQLGCRFRLDVIPPTAEHKAASERIGTLFRKLGEASEACEAAEAAVGQRTYPLTRIAVRTAGAACALAVEGIRRNPHFWHREAYLFSAMLFSAEQLLERVTFKGSEINRAIAALRAAATILEDVADEQAAERERMKARSAGRAD